MKVGSLGIVFLMHFNIALAFLSYLKMITGAKIEWITRIGYLNLRKGSHWKKFSFVGFHVGKEDHILF